MQASSFYVERLVYFTKKLRRNERISSELPLYRKLFPLGLSILWYVRYLFFEAMFPASFVFCIWKVQYSYLKSNTWTPIRAVAICIFIQITKIKEGQERSLKKLENYEENEQTYIWAENVLSTNLTSRFETT